MFVSYRATGSLLSSATVGDRELPIYCVDTTENKVALSFDAAWGAEDFPKIMDTLDKHKVKVTFFMTGGWASDNPDCVKELVKRGHDLGNHSEHHYDMTTISQSERESELQSVHDKVKELTGYEMFLFRPPYGAYDNSVIKTAYQLNYYPIQWSVDSLDWKDYGVDSIIDTVCNHKALGPVTFDATRTYLHVVRYFILSERSAWHHRCVAGAKPRLSWMDRKNSCTLHRHCTAACGLAVSRYPDAGSESPS